MSDQNVVTFPGAPLELPEQTITLEKRTYNTCQHGKISLDTHQRLANCVDYGAVIDPFQYLASNAVVLQRAWQDYASVKYSLKDISDRVLNLKKEEARLRAVVRRLKDKQPVIDTRGKDIL